MSIWCSYENIGWDEYSDDPTRPNGGEVRSYASGWSNHYPTTDGQVEQPASIGLATVPPWCVPGQDEDMDDWDRTGPWIRLHVLSQEHEAGVATGERSYSAVVLDVDAARTLGQQLLDWANSEHVEPVADDVH